MTPGEWLAHVAAVLDQVDYYTLLEVDSEADSLQIREAFLTFAAFAHPDRYNDDPPTAALAHEVFKRGNEAYRVLKNPVLRKRYGQALEAGELRMPIGFDQQRDDGDDVPLVVRDLYVKAQAALESGRLAEAKMHVLLARSRVSCSALDRLEAAIHKRLR